MKPSVMVLESALVLGLCLVPGCASRRTATIQDPAYSSPMGPAVSGHPPAAIQEPSTRTVPPEPPPIKPPASLKPTSKPAAPESTASAGPSSPVVNEAPPP